MARFGIIAGSGLYAIPGMEIAEKLEISTPFGSPSDRYRKGAIGGHEVFFMPRHGSGHGIQPHRINYRANIWGFRELGVDRIISIGATGAINADFKPGGIILPDQIIDFTDGRATTFHEGDLVFHIDFTEPFCPELREYLFSASGQSQTETIRSGTYICVNGPRLETAAEIRTFHIWGADIVGMTLMPEAALAREAGICFASISVVTNFAAGITGRKLTSAEVVKTMAAASGRLEALLHSFFTLDFAPRGCGCGQALEEAGM